MNNSDTKKNTMVPKLRFPEFESTGIWKNKSFNEIAHFYKGKGVSKADISLKGSMPCIRYGELYTHYNEVINDVISKTNLQKEELFLSKKNDVIIPSSGETKWDIARASCVMLDNIALGGDLNVIRSKENGIFISYYLNGVKKTELSTIAQGDTVAHLYASQLKLIELLVPPQNEEQQKIGDCLSSVDDLILAQEKKIDLLQKHKNGMLQQFFPRSGEVLPEVRFQEFASVKEWSLTKLCSIGTVFQGNGFPEIYQGRIKGKYPFYKVSDISASFQKGNCVIHSAANYIDDHELKIIRATIVPSGTTIFAKIGEAIRLNRRVITSCESLIDNNTAGVKSIHGKSNDMFIFYLLSQINLIEYAGGAIPSVRKTAIEDITISVPPSEKEQQKIADCLSSLDELISLEIKKLELFKIHKKGLMQQLFPSMDEVS